MFINYTVAINSNKMGRRRRPCTQKKRDTYPRSLWFFHYERLLSDRDKRNHRGSNKMLYHPSQYDHVSRKYIEERKLWSKDRNNLTNPEYVEDIQNALFHMFRRSTHHNNVMIDDMKPGSHWSKTEIEDSILQRGLAVDYFNKLNNRYEELCGSGPLFNNCQYCEIRERGIACGQSDYEEELKYRATIKHNVFKLAATTAEVRQREREREHKYRVFDDAAEFPQTWDMFTGDV